jgi:hypothetical protein
MGIAEMIITALASPNPKGWEHREKRTVDSCRRKDDVGAIVGAPEGRAPTATE